MLKTMRKALSLVLVMTMLLSMACMTNIGVSAKGTSYIMGDVNGDGVVNVRDATEIQYYVAKLSDFTADQMYLADVDGQVGVNVRDATYIQDYAARMLDEFATNPDGKKLLDEVNLEDGKLVDDEQPTTESYS